MATPDDGCRHLSGRRGLEGVVLLLFPAQGGRAFRGRHRVDGRRARESNRGYAQAATTCVPSSAAVLGSLESTMRNSTPELLIEAILEGYRQACAGHDHLEQTSVIFAEVFDRAVGRRQASRRFDVATSPTSHSHLVSEGARSGRPGQLRRSVLCRGRRPRHRRIGRRLQLTRDLMDRCSL